MSLSLLVRGQIRTWSDLKATKKFSRLMFTRNTFVIELVEQGNLRSGSFFRFVGRPFPREGRNENCSERRHKKT